MAAKRKTSALRPFQDEHPRTVAYFPFSDRGRRQVLPDGGGDAIAWQMAHTYAGHDTYALSDDDIELLSGLDLVADGRLRRGAFSQIEALLISSGMSPQHASELSTPQALDQLRLRVDPRLVSVASLKGTRKSAATRKPGRPKDKTSVRGRVRRILIDAARPLTRLEIVLELKRDGNVNDKTLTNVLSHLAHHDPHFRRWNGPTGHAVYARTELAPAAGE